MSKRSSLSPAFVFMALSLLGLVAIAFGFYLGGENGYAISAFCVAGVCIILGIIEVFDLILWNPIKKFVLTFFHNSEDLNI